MPSPAILPSLLLLLILFMLLSGIVGSWAWVLWRVRNGQPIVPSLVDTPQVPWGLGSVILVVLTWAVVNTAVVVIYSKTTQAVAPPVAKAAKEAGPAVARTLGFTEQLFLVSLTNLILLAVIPVLLRLASGARLADLGLVRRALVPQFVTGAVAFFLVSPFVYAINGLAVLIWKPESHPLEKMVRNELSLGIAELAVLSAVILAPATEELLFRGVIQRWLHRIFTLGAVDEAGYGEPTSPSEAALLREGLAGFEVPPGPWNELATDSDDHPYASPSHPIVAVATRPQPFLIQPIAITSFLFAAVHFPQWPAPLGIFVLSLGLGYLAQKSGSLIAAIVMHSLFNGLSTLLLFVIVQLGPLAIPPKKEAGIAAPSCVVPGQSITETLMSREPGTVLHFSDQ